MKHMGQIILLNPNTLPILNVIEPMTQLPLSFLKKNKQITTFLYNTSFVYLS